MTAKDWLGNSVIDRLTGEFLGRVIRLISSPDRKAAVCLIIRPLDPRMPLRTLPWEKAIFGKPALALGTDCQPLAATSPFWEKWDHRLPLGLPGFDENGTSLGLCCDVNFDSTGVIIGFVFSSGARIASENIAHIGSAAIILGKSTELSSSSDPLSASPLRGRIVTQDIMLASGEILAPKDAVVDEALLQRAEAAGRLVALTLHTKPSN